MALVFFDAVADTTATTGTGTWTTAGAPPAGFRSFSIVTNSDTFYYRAESADKSQWENGVGTKSSSTIARTTVLASSNSGSAVNFTTGPTIYMTVDAAHHTNTLRKDAASQSVTGGANVTALDLGTQSSGTLTIAIGACSVQKVTANGAFTLAASGGGSTILKIYNGASAGAITFSGFTMNISDTGAAYATTSGATFWVMIWGVDSVYGYCILRGQ